MKPCLIAALVCLLPFILSHPIQTEEQSAIQPQQETLESVALDDTVNYDGTTRDKRTIGPLRQIFPNLSQLVDRKIQMITRVLFRVIGRLVLRGGLGGGGGGGGGDSTSSSASSSGGGTPGRRISITLPTYPPGEDDDEDEDEDDAAAKSSNTETTTVGSEANELSGAESQNNEVRVQYTAVEEDQEPAAAAETDQQAEADAEEITDADEGRNKRFLPFNLGGGGSAGSGGGSGNFLFDIIRLVAGSGNTEASDEKANSAVGVATLEQVAEKDDGYQAGVPGPITRLFVIANRGIANLMQDLILRLAQTSERIVNFKARLITSII